MADSLNRVDEHNKKTGYWVEYLNSRMKPAPCKDARYALLAYYWKGRRVLPVGQPNKPFSGNPEIIIDKASMNETIGTDSIFLINGEVTLKYWKGTSVLSYDNGLIKFERYTPATGTTIETVDYSSHYLNNPYSCKLAAEGNGVDYLAFIGIIDGQFKCIRLK